MVGACTFNQPTPDGPALWCRKRQCCGSANVSAQPLAVFSSSSNQVGPAETPLSLPISAPQACGSVPEAPASTSTLPTPPSRPAWRPPAATRPSTTGRRSTARFSPPCLPSRCPQRGSTRWAWTQPAGACQRSTAQRRLACVGLKSGKARTSLQHRLPAETGREPGESRESNKTGVEQGDMQRKQLTGHASKRVYDWQSGMAHWGETQRYGSMGWPNGSAER